MSAGKVDVLALLRDPHYDEHCREDMVAAADAVAALLQADRAFDLARARKQEVDNRLVRLNTAKQMPTEDDFWDRKSADHSYARADEDRKLALERLGVLP